MGTTVERFVSLSASKVSFASCLCGVVWWLQAEAGKSAVKSVHCPGLLVSLGWLIIIPYHLLKTRGARGLLPLLALTGTFLFAYMLAGVVYLAFRN
jgi:hypothetical protein